MLFAQAVIMASANVAASCSSSSDDCYEMRGASDLGLGTTFTLSDASPDAPPMLQGGGGKIVRGDASRDELFAQCPSSGGSCGPSIHN